MTRGIIFTTIGAVCWGFSATCIQLLVTEWALPVEWVTSMRLIIAGPLFLLAGIATSGNHVKQIAHDRPNLVRVLLFGLLGILGCQLAYFHCTAWTNAGTATTLERLALLFILGWACYTARRLPYWKEIVGIVLALAGVFVIATQGNPSVIVLPWEGLLWGLGDAFGTACYMILPTKPLEKYSPLVITGIGMTFAALLAWALFQPWNIAVPITPAIVGIFFLFIAIGTIGSYACYLEGIKDCGSVLAGMLS